ncbi:hypothetical protein GCM10027047_31940 [Rhodococcus aerolatus]
MAPTLTLTVRLNPSAADARRGVVRLHPEVLAALGLREWAAVSLLGARRTAAVAAAAPGDTAPGTALLDDVALSNTGLREGAAVVVEAVSPAPARRVTLAGSTLATRSVPATTLRQVLLGKVLTTGDTVSLLPRDVGPDTGAAAARGALSGAIGPTWTTELLTVTATEPAGPVAVGPGCAAGWAGAATTDGAAGGAVAGGAVADGGADGAAPDGHPAAAPTPPSTPSRPDATGPDLRSRAHAGEPSPPTPVTRPLAVADLLGAQDVAARLAEWLELSLDHPALLAGLGASGHLGVLLSGPAGVGKATLVRTVAADRTVVELDGPTVGAVDPGTALDRVRAAVARVSGGGVLLVSDVEALLPDASRTQVPPAPVATLVLDELRAATARPGVALVATTSEPDAVDPRLRAPDLCDRDLGIALPDARVRAGLLELLLRDLPTTGVDAAAVAARTPGFVAADLLALRRDAALRAAARARRGRAEPAISQADLLAAAAATRPLSRSGTDELAVGSLALDDVGDMVETKAALTEAVLWPLQHPDSFTRLGVEPPRGVLLYGPPGCGKTFLVRALAGSGRLSVHAVKGGELMDRWVGASEKAVRDLFARARGSAPSLVFLDEVDALAPRRGQSSDSGVADRVVAALLTELDGVEPLRDVVVLGATNRPELVDPALLRPGRLERLVFVPPPDAQARAAVLRAAGAAVPLADDVDLDALADDLDGFSAADCAALLREAAMAAMRRSVDAAAVSAADVAAARAAVRPSLDPVQVAALQAYADRR